MATEEIFVRVSEKGVAKLKSLINLQESLEKIRRGGGKVDTALARVNKQINKSTKGAKGVALQFKRFKFELLGVLFFGMAVQRFMTGLLKPSLEVAGVFEILNDTLAILFLPTASNVSEVLLEISDIILSLPEPIQRIIGDFVLLGAGAGTLFSAFGQLALGLASVKIAFGVTIAEMALFLGKAALVAIAVEGLIILFENWDEITTDIKFVLGLLLAAVAALAIALGAPFVAIVAGITAAIILLKVAYDELRESLGTTGFKDTIKAAFNEIIGKINEFLEVVNLIPGIEIPGLPKFTLGGPEGVIGVTEQVAGNQPVTNEPFKIGDSFFNIVINTTNGVDEVSLKDELKDFINESSARGVGNVTRGRP